MTQCLATRTRTQRAMATTHENQSKRCCGPPAVCLHEPQALRVREGDMPWLACCANACASGLCTVP
eukprot:1153509-Pelagomonas_calceolata.AAC.12